MVHEQLESACTFETTPAMNSHKLLKRISSGEVRNVSFSDLVKLVEGLGFELSRIRGSHHVFVHPDISELVNLQDVKGQAKPYQVRQLLKLIERYNLRLTRDT